MGLPPAYPISVTSILDTGAGQAWAIPMYGRIVSRCGDRPKELLRQSAWCHYYRLTSCCQVGGRPLQCGKWGLDNRMSEEYPCPRGRSPEINRLCQRSTETRSQLLRGEKAPTGANGDRGVVRFNAPSKEE